VILKGGSDCGGPPPPRQSGKGLQLRDSSTIFTLLTGHTKPNCGEQTPLPVKAESESLKGYR
jgi:hypothetical protein